MLKNKILYILIIILTFSYVISFTKSCTSKDKRIIVETALVNQKNLNNINQILLADNKTAQTILLEKSENIWLVNGIPANKTKVLSFLEDLTKVRKLYKHSESLKQENGFGLNDGTEFAIRYWISDSQMYDIFTGKTDFSGNYRYLMTGKNLTVYEIETDFDKYLSSLVQSWNDPFIISQSVLGKISDSDVDSVITTYNNQTKIIKSATSGFKTSVSKLLELRNGGPFYSEKKSENVLIKIQLNLGNKDTVEITVFASDESSEQEFLVKSEYYDESENKKYSYDEKISFWTYNKIKEIML